MFDKSLIVTYAEEVMFHRRLSVCLFVCLSVSLLTAHVKATHWIFDFHESESHRSESDLSFLPRCMECRRALAMRKQSVCLSVRRSVRQTREL